MPAASPGRGELSLSGGQQVVGRFLSGLSRSWTQARLAVIAVRDDGQDSPGLAEVAVVMISDGRVGAARSWRRSQVDRDDAFGQITAALITAALAGAEIVAGHHVRDGLAVLSRALPGWQPPVPADTSLLARNLCPALPSHDLPALAAALGLNTPPIPGAGHGVTHDAVLTARLLLALATELSDVRSLVLAASTAGGTGPTGGSS